jgi:hypothetical protein
MESDPEKQEKLKNKLLELDYLYQEAMDADAAADRAYDRIMRAVTDTAMTIFPELKEMEPDQIRNFGDSISTHVFRIVEELDRISMWVEQPEQFDADGNLRRDKQG